MMSSLVFLMLSDRMVLLSEHHSASLQTLSLCVVSSPFEISPATVESSANFMIVFEEFVGMQSYV